MSAVRTISARQGETLDALIWRVFARGSGMVEAVLAANRDLAAQGPVLREGTVVVVPEATDAPQPTDEVKLWD